MQQFSDEFVGSAPMQAMQKRITIELDPAIEKMGFAKMRSRITIGLKSGKPVAGWTDERYRGGPENPLNESDLEAKVCSCCEGVLDERRQTTLIEAGRSIFTIVRFCAADAITERSLNRHTDESRSPGDETWISGVRQGGKILTFDLYFAALRAAPFNR